MDKELRRRFSSGLVGPADERFYLVDALLAYRNLEVNEFVQIVSCEFLASLTSGRGIRRLQFASLHDFASHLLEAETNRCQHQFLGNSKNDKAISSGHQKVDGL